MRRTIISFVTVLISLYAALSFADAAQHTVTPTAAADAPQRGALYRVRHQGNTAYLFGTIHVGQAAFYPLEPQVTRALSQSTQLVLEMDLRKSAQFQQAIDQYGMYGAGRTIDQQLSADSVRQLKTALQRFGIPFESVARMKPWMAANLLLAVDLERNGYQASLGTDLYLLSLAQAQAKTVRELETADYQLSLFDQLTPAQQEQYLRETLAELADGSGFNKTKAMIDAWRSADAGAMENLLREMQNEKSASSDFMQRVLLDQRNPNMAAGIEALLRKNKSTFVGVGMLHLLGEGGLPTLLRQRGYEVKKLY
jgi:uncharacterized protein YbaP (TraB family)